MATRVTPYLGGTGQDNTRKLNAHPSLNRVSIGADVLASANLDVFGNTFVRGNVETANTFVSTSNSSIPNFAWLGETAGGRWATKSGSSAFTWYSDTLVTPVTGFTSITYYGTTFYPKISFGSLGDISVSGKFATNAAQINRDGTASFGSLTVPALNTVGITGNVYISGNLFVGGNSYQITTNITQAVGNVITGNAFVVTRLVGEDIPLSNGITFSNTNLVISAYANPMVVFSANNNVWVGANTAIIGRSAAIWTYNPYQLVDDGLVVQHNGGRGNIIQTWIDGRTGTTTRPWSLGLTTQGDMAWLVGTAANVKPTIQRMMIDQNGNTLFGTGTVNRANVTITGNASISTNLTVSGNVYIGAPTWVIQSGVPNLGDSLIIVPPPTGVSAQSLPIAMTSGSTYNASSRVWAFGMNYGGSGNAAFLVSASSNTRPITPVMHFSLGGNVTANSNFNVTNNLTVSGEFTSPNFSRANTLNDAAVHSACVSRGWPIPGFGAIALPEIDPPGNFLIQRTTTANRINDKKLMEEVPINKIRHEYDIDTGEYLGWGFNGSTTKTQAFLWSNNLTITQQLTVTANTGVFINGEYVNDGSNTGVYVTGSATLYGIAGNSAAPLLGTVLTGNTSGFTATISSQANIWHTNNMVVASNVTGLSGEMGHGTYLEALAANATVSQLAVVSNASRYTFFYIKKIAGTGNVSASYGGSTWVNLTNKTGQPLILTNNYTEARLYAASGVNPNVYLRLESAGDKIAVGNIQLSSAGNFAFPAISNCTATSITTESITASIANVIPAGSDYTMYVKCKPLYPAVASAYMMTIGNSDLANLAYIFNASGIIHARHISNSQVNFSNTSSHLRSLETEDEVSLIARYSPGNLALMGNERLATYSTAANALAPVNYATMILGKRPGLSTSGAGIYTFKEVMIWPYALSNAEMRLIATGSKDAIPSPFIENPGGFAPVMQALTKLKLGVAANVSIECAGDSYGTGATAGTASWPYYLAKHLDTTYSNSSAAVGWASTSPNLAPAHSDKMTVSYPTGSWTHAYRTAVGPSLSTSTTTTANGYISYNLITTLGTTPAARLIYVGTADGQVEYSWNAGVTRYALDLTSPGVGNIGYHDLANVADSTLRIYRLAGTITIAGVNFTNTDSGAVIHKMCVASAEAKDWYTVNSTQWKIGYELVNPTASIIMLGTYDQAQIATYNWETFAFYLQDMINRRRATDTNKPIMIVMPPDNRRSNLTPMDYYSREARKIAALNNCTFVDLQHMFGATVADYDTSWWSDTIVPNLNDGGPALVAGILRALESASL